MSKPAGQVAGDGIDARPTLPRQQVQTASAAGRAELSGKLAGLTLRQQVVVLAIWPLLEQFLNFLVGFVDLTLAGRLSPPAAAMAATDALGVGGYVGWLMAMIYASVGVGAIALIARATGARHRSLGNASLGQAMLLAMIGGVGIGVLVFVAAPTIARLANLNDVAWRYCVTYLRIITLASPFAALMLVGNACLRGAGDTRTPFFVMVLVNVANVILSLLFVYGPAPLGGHGVAGIAAGTAAAWVIGAAVVLLVLFRGWGSIRLHWHRLRPHRHTLRRIIHVAWPNLFESVGGMWVGNFLVLMIVGRLVHQGVAGAPGVIGAHMIIIRVESFSFMLGFAIGTAAATLTGQYLGLGDPQRARRAVHIAFLYAAGLMGCLGILFLVIPRELASIITDVPELLDLAETPVRLTGLVQVFFASHAVFASALRGAGDTRTTFRITVITTFLIRLPLVFLVGVVFKGGLTAVWIALCAELTLRGIITACFFLRGKWMSVRV